MKPSATTYFYFFIIFIFFFEQAQAQIPTQDLKVWLCADSGMVLSGSNVAQWTDLSGNGNHFTQGIPARRPLLQNNSINGKSSVFFDGSDDILECDFNDTINQPNTFFILVKLGTANSDEFIFDGINSSYRNAYVYYPNTNSFLAWAGASANISKTLNDYALHTLVFSGSNSKVYINGSLVYSGDIGSNALSGLKLGSSIFNLYLLNGWVTDFLYYNKTFSGSNRIQIENYLMDKYAPPVSLGSDIVVPHGFCSKTLDAGSGKKSYLWSNGETSQSIQVSRSGVYWVQTTDIFGRDISDTIQVQFPFSPMPDRGLCMSDTINVNPGLNNAYTYLWNDASTDSVLKVFNPGTYWVEITDSTTLHCSIRDSITITADSFPVQANLGTDRSFCAGDKLRLQNVQVAVSNYTWSTGTNTAEISINSTGQYRITATDVNGCELNDTVNINIKGLRPRVGFSNLNTCEGTAMEFADTSYTVAPDEIASRAWIFQPGDTSHLLAPSYVFPSNGNFNVKLIVVSDSGCIADTTRTVHVLKNPVANFKPAVACTGKDFNFVSLSASSEGTLNTWIWNFGDGNTATGDTANYHYDVAGSYNVRLIILNQYACRDTIIKGLVVRNTPAVNFTGDDGCFGSQIQFEETTDVPAQEAIMIRHWNFGDGIMSSIKNPLHLYNDTGSFQVTLYNKSLNGCADSTTKTITIHPLPVAGFINSLPCNGNPVEFADTSLFGSTRIWTINGTDYFDSLVNITFPDTGVYQVRLQSFSPYACKSSTNRQIYVFPSPETSFTFSPEYGIPPLEVQFLNTTEGVSSLLWDFDDESTSVMTNPTHQFTAEAIYNVTLTVQNSYGCHTVAIQPVYVIPSTLDLVIENLELNDTTGYVKPVLTIFNNGTRNVRKILIDAGFTGVPGISKIWSGLLQPGQTISYDPDIYFRKPDDKQVFCIGISSLDAVGQQDVTESNNYFCQSLADGFALVQIFPNPADDKIFVDINLPFEGKLRVEVVNSEGSLTYTSDTPTLNQGMNRLSVSLEGFRAGIYHLRVIYEDKSESRSFIIGH